MIEKKDFVNNVNAAKTKLQNLLYNIALCGKKNSEPIPINDMQISPIIQTNLKNSLSHKNSEEKGVFKIPYPVKINSKYPSYSSSSLSFIDSNRKKVSMEVIPPPI